MSIPVAGMWVLHMEEKFLKSRKIYRNLMLKRAAMLTFYYLTSVLLRHLVKCMDEEFNY